MIFYEQMSHIPLLYLSSAVAGLQYDRGMDIRGTLFGMEQSGIPNNVRDIRSFSGTKWKKNLGEGRAEG